MHFIRLVTSVAEPEPPGEATFRASRSRLFCWPEPATSFWQEKKESLVVVKKHDLRAIYNGKCDLKKTN